MTIGSPVAGVIEEILCQSGQMVSAGQQLAIVRVQPTNKGTLQE
jgi:biotin carboxyl carrier protein